MVEDQAAVTAYHGKEKFRSVGTPTDKKEVSNLRGLRALLGTDMLSLIT